MATVEERLLELEARIQQAQNIAQHHAPEHFDEGNDPMSEQQVVQGHGHDEIRDNDGDTKWQAEESADEDILRADTGGTERLTIESTGLRMQNGTIYIKEQAEANADAAAYGQVWVDTQAPNALFFTDDAGTDFSLSLRATATISGPVELATIAETTTGTDATRAVSPDGLAGSEYGERAVQLVVFDFATDVATGDGKYHFHIDSRIAGMNLVDVHAEVITAGTTNTTDIQVRNVTQGADMLSTVITIDSGETGSDTAATAAVIDTANDDVVENDMIRIDVDATSTTKAKGLIITLGWRLP